MISKKLVAIVLAVGLVLSIGVVLGQYNIAKKDIGRLLYQQQGTLGIVPNYTLDELDTHKSADKIEFGYFTPPIEYSGEEDEQYWNGLSPVISRYEIFHGISKEWEGPRAELTGDIGSETSDLVAAIECKDSEYNTVGVIYFMSDNSYDAKVRNPGDLIKVSRNSFLIEFLFPYRRFDEIVGTFKNGGIIRLAADLDPTSGGYILSENIVSNSS